MIAMRFLGAGLLLFIIGLVLLLNRMVLLTKGTFTHAVVMTMKERKDSDGIRSFDPVFSFTTTHNEEMTYYGSSNDPHNWHVGDTAKIVYDKNSPNNVVLLTFYNTYCLSIVLIALGTGLIALASGGYFAHRFFNTLQ